MIIFWKRTAEIHGTILCT